MGCGDAEGLVEDCKNNTKSLINFLIKKSAPFFCFTVLNSLLLLSVQPKTTKYFKFRPQWVNILDK